MVEAVGNRVGRNAPLGAPELRVGGKVGVNGVDAIGRRSQRPDSGCSLHV